MNLDLVVARFVLLASVACYGEKRARDEWVANADAT
jgi:hypothetical protein